MVASSATHTLGCHVGTGDNGCTPDPIQKPWSALPSQLRRAHRHARPLPTCADCGAAQREDQAACAGCGKPQAVCTQCMRALPPDALRARELPAAVRARVAVEAGITDYWYRFTGLDGKIVGMTGFGASAPAGDLYKHFNITAEAVQAAVESVI